MRFHLWAILSILISLSLVIPSQSQDLRSLIPKELFERMLISKRINDPECPGEEFYTYEAFFEAAEFYPDFGNTGDNETRLREFASFLGQTSYETTDYCYIDAINQTSSYCDDSSNQEWPCAPGKKYFGRGPIQLSWNYNYGPCGVALEMPLLDHPELISADPVTAFRASLWFWMTAQGKKPSIHDVITGQWEPSDCDIKANRLPGYGVITNIINGGLECKGRDSDHANKEAIRIRYYKLYCFLIFGIGTGEHIGCANQAAFDQGCGSSSVASI